MSERQMLEMGIRAMGIVFIVHALTEAFSAVAPLVMGFGVTGLFVAFACTRVVIAVVVTRLAPRIASWIMEPVVTVDNPSSVHLQSWNRWLIASAGVFAVGTLWLQSIINTARTFVFTMGAGVGDSQSISGLSGTIVAETLLILVITYAIFRRPQWIVGRDARGL